jgi:hypothetical protein
MVSANVSSAKACWCFGKEIHMRAIELVATTTLIMSTAIACSTQNHGVGNDTSKKATSAPPTPATATNEGGARDTISEQARVARLEADARALVKATGCNSATECRTAPVGERACGGPRDYIMYCPATTDSVALFAKLDQLKAAEAEYNKNSGMMSTCEFRSPPKTALVGGSCRPAATP